MHILVFMQILIFFCATAALWCNLFKFSFRDFFFLDPYTHARCLLHSKLVCMQIASASLLINGCKNQCLGFFLNTISADIEIVQFATLFCWSVFFLMFSVLFPMSSYCSASHLFNLPLIKSACCPLITQRKKKSCCHKEMHIFNNVFFTSGFPHQHDHFNMLAAVWGFRNAKSCPLTWVACYILISCLTIILV